jgi:hypothetical protein
MRRVIYPYHEPPDPERADDEARRRWRREVSASTDHPRAGVLARLLNLRLMPALRR